MLLAQGFVAAARLAAVETQRPFFFFFLRKGGLRATCKPREVRACNKAFSLPKECISVEFQSNLICIFKRQPIRRENRLEVLQKAFHSMRQRHNLDTVHQPVWKRDSPTKEYQSAVDCHLPSSTAPNHTRTQTLLFGLVVKATL